MNIYEQTLLMLDACNLSGLAHSFSRDIVPAIWTEIRSSAGGIASVNRHPVAVLWTMKMVDLAAGECLCSLCVKAFGKAYSIVKEKAKIGTT